MFRLLLLTAALAGCHIDLNDPGTDPPLTQFYFPVGIAYDTATRADGHVDRYLYISNGNADLRYAGGLIQLVDVRRFECAVYAYCNARDGAGNFVHACPDTLTNTDPVCNDDASVDADVTAAACQSDPLDPSVIDCDETPFILGNAAVRVGNFAGGLQFLKQGQFNRLFVSVRGDPSVTWMTVNLDNVHIGAPAPTKVLDCFDPGTVVADQAVHAPGCANSHTLFGFGCMDNTGCGVENPNLPSEPFGMYLDTGTIGGEDYANLLVSSLATGQVTLIDARGDNHLETDKKSPNYGKPTMIRNVSQPFFQADAAGRHGAFALAPQFPGNPSSPWYMTSNLQATIATFRVAQVGVIVPSVSFNIGGAFAVGSDIRDIAFEPGGNRAFLTENNPPSVLVLDTRVTDGRNPGQPVNQLVDIIDVCQEPSHLGVRRSLVAGSPGSPDRPQTELYVACFLSNQIMVVDPDAAQVEDTILVGRGPNAMVFNFGDADDHVTPAPPARRAFVTHFSEMSIGVIDLEPGSPTRNRLVARIGKPLPPPHP
jgi:hypothetical protein